MVKTIKIDGKSYDMKSSAYTQFAYKNETGRSLLDDIQHLQNINVEEYSNLDNFIELITDISYVMIKEADEKQVQNKIEFLKGINNLLEDTDWITQVIELAIMPLSRGNIQKS